MSADDAPSAAATVAKAEKATESLSQFVARVLNQLSLSAWLPSAALVLLVDFVGQLGTVLGTGRPGAAGAIGSALSRMSGIGVGGAVLLVVAVIVLTMLTQAFSFEAIRVLEGYWGTATAAEWLGRRRASWHRRRLKKLATRRRELTEEAWLAAKVKIEELEDQRRQARRRPELTAAMIARLEARVLGTFPAGRRLSPGQLARIRGYDWQRHAPAELLRRRVNVDKRLSDFPRPERTLPTRLGNILRAHEDQVGGESVESYVQRVFDKLPPSLQENHDEQRTRLDLYCSMVFVVGLSGLTGVAILAPRHWPYAASTAGAALIGMWLMHRAALATARAYGQLLVTIATVAAAA
jgi:hypothetical protein